MRLVDTTDPQAKRGVQTLFSRDGAARELRLASGLRLEIDGLCTAAVGPEWSSAGRRESHYLHALDLALSGRRQVVFGDEVLEILPGNIYFWPGNTPLERRCRERCEVLFMYLRLEWLPGVDPLLDWPTRRPLCLGPYDPAFVEAWRRPQPEISAGSLYRLLAQVQLWLAQALPDLDDMISSHLRSHAPFTAAFEMAEKQLGADLRVEALAAAHGVNPDAFSRAFKRNTGLSPKDFLQRRLNQEALRLITGTDLQVRQVAERLRFANEFHFSRFFKKLNGVAPLGYRQRLRG